MGRSNSKVGRLVFLFITGAFLIGGLFILSQPIRYVAKNVATKNWEKTPANVLQVSLEERRSDDEEGRTTYRVNARYAYEFAGTAYTSGQLDFLPGSDNLGSYHHDTYEKLKQVKDRGEEVTCYVNPEAPAEAVLFREIRWGLVFFLLAMGLLFACIGGWMFTRMLGTFSRRGATCRC